MDVYLILLFVVVFLLSCVFLSRPRGVPPGPPSLPIIGSVTLLNQLRKGIPHVVFTDAAKSYGNVYSFELACQLFVVLNGYDMIHQAFVNRAESFNDRPNFLRLFKSALKDGKGLLFQSYNHQWKIMRRFTLRTLRDFGVGKSSIEEKITDEVKHASKVLRATKGEAIEISPLVQNIIGNVIHRIIFGNRYNYDEQEFHMIRKMIDILVKGQLVSPANFFPEWFIYRFRNNRFFNETYLLLDNLEKLKQYVHKMREQHEETYDENHIRDFIDLYIQVSRDSKEDELEVFTKGNMLRVIIDLFLAGYETTSNTLDWAFLFMSEYPEIQKKCQEEIDDVLEDKQVEYADRGKLKYVDATLMEIQRLANIAPLGALHSTTKDVKLMGYNIPKHTIIISNLYSVLMGPAHWKEPTKFDPARFIDEAGNIIKDETFIPFSVGPRACLGEPLARMELFIVFVHMLQHFQFAKENEEFKHSMESKPNQLTLAPLPYKLKVSKR